MKLTFRLEGSEVARVQKLIKTIKEWHDGSNEIPGIRIKTKKSKNRIIFEGRRKSFLEDGGFALIMKMFGTISVATNRITYYETSDNRLNWFETFPIFLKRADWLEVIDDIREVLHLIAGYGPWPDDDFDPLLIIKIQKIPKGLFGMAVDIFNKNDLSVKEKIDEIDTVFNEYAVTALYEKYRDGFDNAFSPVI